MIRQYSIKSLPVFIFCILFIGQQLTAKAMAQVNGEDGIDKNVTVQYNKLSLSMVEPTERNFKISSAEDVELVPLTLVEENIANNLSSHWAWPEYTLEMIDSYSPFLFRTKKSQEVEEVKVHLKVDSKGKVSGYELVSEVDKGLKERIDYLVRKLPKCKPVPGFSNYSPEVFELTIRK
ncbi:hypothetical protein [Algoriphagus sp. PAP.12]|uniref:hypothetical protein n=1 Tax=Algoriphagus sp. PAP.12 TaxID=2996678 RepID=UPI00227B4313|nr:hypothetical protein [Algoriphagus sp. PAP.12]